MRQRGPAAAARHGAAARQKRGLTRVSFVGSFPTADFRPAPALPEVALLGRSNVGKSSLLNALAHRRNLARTSRSPGKTRTCNLYRADDAYYLVDLPGYGYARRAKEERRRFRRLLEDYLTGRTVLAGVVWLLDIRRDPSRDDLAMADLLAAHRVSVLVALTKADKLPRGRRAGRREEIAAALNVPDDQCVTTSAEKRWGIDELREAIEHLVRGAEAA